MSSPNVSPAMRWGLNALLLFSAVLALYLGQSIFIPLVIALLLAAMLWPAAERLRQGVPFPAPTRSDRFPWIGWPNRLSLPWVLACTVVVLLLVALALTVMCGIGLVVPKLLQDLPTDPARQQEVYTSFRDRLEQVSPVPLNPEYFPEDAADFKLLQSIREILDPRGPYLINLLSQLASFGGSWLWYFVLITFILLFLLVEGPMLGQRVVEIFGPSAEAQERALIALRDMANQVRVYLVWRTIINFALALFVGLFYQWLGLRQPWTWALFTGVLCYIPYLGPIVAGIPPVLDAFVSCPTPWYAVVVFAFYVVLTNVEGYLIVPLVMGRHMELNATTVLLACLFWDLVWGTPGLFLAMPLMAAIKSICVHVPGWQPWANLMSTHALQPPRRPPTLGPTVDGLEDTQVLTAEEARALMNPPEKVAKKE